MGKWRHPHRLNPSRTKKQNVSILGAKIREVRLSQGETIQSLATSVGVSPQTIVDIEAGRKKTSFVFAPEILVYFPSAYDRRGRALFNAGQRKCGDLPYTGTLKSLSKFSCRQGGIRGHSKNHDSPSG
ncbi:helix-turn-helix domain-containing protein [Leptospirillum ferriphilum]|uniref:helix-turn-helix transcriptional regulator n=1 Tax=Leptospirillum ferriphilum TaxID=178606 RepID=UPI0015D47950